MTRHVALLRGINVGRAKRIAMADLRALVERLGYRDVKTLLNSGNVVFTAPAAVQGAPGPRIEKAMTAKLGVSARVTTLTAEEFDEIAAANPLAKVADDPSRLIVAVFATPADAQRADGLRQQDWTPDVFALGDRAAYLWCKGGILESRLADAFGKTMKDAVTSRNWATVKKLQALLAALD